MQDSGFEPFHIKSTSARARSILVRAAEAGETRKVLKTVSRAAAKEIRVDVAAAAVLPEKQRTALQAFPAVQHVFFLNLNFPTKRTARRRLAR